MGKLLDSVYTRVYFCIARVCFLQTSLSRSLEVFDSMNENDLATDAHSSETRFLPWRGEKRLCVSNNRAGISSGIGQTTWLWWTNRGNNWSLLSINNIKHNRKTNNTREHWGPCLNWGFYKILLVSDGVSNLAQRCVLEIPTRHSTLYTTDKGDWSETHVSGTRFVV